MKKLTNIFLSLYLTLALVFGGPGLALAQEAPSPSPEASSQAESSSQAAGNTDTGSDSTNTSTNDTTNTSTTTNANDSTTTNDTTANTDSGSNTTTDNTGDGSVTSSDSSTSTSNTTTTNTNHAPMPWTTWTGEGDWTTRNQNTGSDSTNTATNNNTTDQSLTNSNDATINNTTAAGSTTGANNSSRNTGNADITTGNASTSTNNANTANTNVVKWTGDGDWTNLWNGEAVNYLTGSQSNNTATNNFNAVLDVLNQNGVDVENLINSFATTGANTASDNTGNATITTGDSSVLANLFNLANTNIFGTDSINILYQDLYSGFAGDVNLANGSSFNLQTLASQPLNLSSENSNTGFDSTNDASINGSMTLNILNENDGTLLNDLDLLSSTGGNVASDNTGNATIETGDASIIANLFNMLNSNIFTNSFYLGMINVWGDWAGNIILPEYNPTAAPTASTGLNSDSTNEFTGSNSNNTSQNNQTSSTTLANTNNGAVINDYNLNLETGANSASDNTRSGSIQSGAVSGEVNEASWINSNLMSNDPWWLIIVNEMGTWTPKLMSPMLANGTQIIMDLDDLGLSSQSQPQTAQVDPSSSSANNNFTGSQSDNTASNNLSTTTTVTNDNDGTIINEIDALALTGANNADRNTGNANIQTGDASLLINAINFLNTNVIAPSFMVAVINVFGSWTGDVLAFGQQAPQAQGQVNSQGNNPPANSNPDPSPAPQGSNPNPSTGNNQPASTPQGNNPDVASSNNNSSSTTYTAFSPLEPLGQTGGSSSSNNSSQSSSGSNENSGGNVLAQVLSFQEEDSEEGAASTQASGMGTNVDSLILQRNIAIALGIILALAFGSYLQRGRLMKLIRRNNPHLA